MNKIEFDEIQKEAKKVSINKFAVGVTICDEGKVLIVKRITDDFLGGLYEIPGGKVESGETIKNAIVRETYEETGLRITNIKSYLGYFDYSSEIGKITRQFNFSVDVEGKNVKLSNEHTDYRWITKEELSRYFKEEDKVKEVLKKFWDSTPKRLKS